MMALALVLLALLWPSGQTPDYAALYSRGVSFSEFLDKASSRREEWRDRYRDAVVASEVVQQARALRGRRLLLVIAEDWCGDSAQSVPYLAKLVEAAPDRLEMRLVDSSVGRSAMDAHQTPDGRGATPTVVVLTADGTPIGAWSERPAELETWSIAQRTLMSNRALHQRIAEWYARDAGKSVLTEIMAILAR